MHLHADARRHDSGGIRGGMAGYTVATMPTRIFCGPKPGEWVLPAPANCDTHANLYGTSSH